MPKKNQFDSLQTSELETMRDELLDRIKRLERDLKEPLEQDYSEQASQLSNRILLTRLLEVERENLKLIFAELNRRELTA